MAGAALSDSDRVTLRAMFDSTVARLAARNIAAWAAQFAEDAVFMPPNHPVVRGRAAIQAWGDSLPPLTDFSFSDVTVEGEGGLAVGTSAYAATFNPPGAPAVPDKGKQLVAFRRQADGSWKVTAGSFSSDLPLPTPPAPKGK
jgi:ketosteroid isomerase-like protein